LRKPSVSNLPFVGMTSSLAVVHAVSLVVAGCDDGSGSAQLAAITTVPLRSYYSELETVAEATARIPDAAKHGFGIIRLVTPDDLHTPALARFFESAARAGVATRAWLVLSQAEGYWPNEDNLAAFGVAVDAFIAWRAANDAPVDWITFDLEPSWQYTHELIDIASGSTGLDRITDLLALVREHVDAAKFAESRVALGGILARVHAAGMRAHCVTYPMVLDDLADGDDDIQDGLDVPVRGLAWDEVSFMTYRSALALYATEPFGPAMFADYARDAVAAFGSRAALDLGVIGADPITGAIGYTDPAALAEDLTAAIAGGVATVHLYSLERAAAESDASAWFTVEATPGAPVPPPDSGTTALRGIFSLLDDVLVQ